MATVSMPSSEAAFGNLALQLSPAFRSVHERALHDRELQRQPSDQQTLSELARSDEFSDDESDGVDSDDDADTQDDDESADTFEDRKPAAPSAPSALGLTPRRHSPYHRAQSAAAAVAATETIDLDDDDLVDIKDTMYVPYRAPPRADRSPRMDRSMQRRATLPRRQQQSQHTLLDAAPSPKSDDWTLVDKSPTFERLTRHRSSASSSLSSSAATTAVDRTSNWFQH